MIIECFTIGLYQTNSYVITDENTMLSAIIDPAGVSKEMEEYIESNRLNVKYIIFHPGAFGARRHADAYCPRGLRNYEPKDGLFWSERI